MKQRRAVLLAMIRGLMLIVLVAFVALGITACRSKPESASRLGRPQAAGVAGAGPDCLDLVTPARIGLEEYERYDIAAKLQDDEFTLREEGGYLVCSHEGQESDGGSPTRSLDLSYTFDDDSSELVLTSIRWLGTAPEPSPTPSAESAPTEDVDYLTVCFDAEIPLIETEGEGSEQWTVWDLLANGRCSIEITGPICWDCGEDVAWHWLIPVSAEAGDGKVCIDARTAVLISGQVLEETEAASLAREGCNLQLGMGQVCWHCPQDSPQPSPEAFPAGSAGVPTVEATGSPATLVPALQEAEAARIAGDMPVFGCRDYVTPEVIGQDAWEHYGIAALLRHDQFRRDLSELADSVACTSDRTVDGVVVLEDTVHWAFDRESGALLMELIHWREDLPEHWPSAQISQQEAEALVEGDIDRSYLAVFGPDTWPFEATKSAFHKPYWLVWTKEGSQGLPAPEVTVVDAVTGEVLGRY